jgi:hypothetical protein
MSHLSPAEHGKYWHDLAQERIAKVSNLEAWAAQDARKIKRLTALLVRADNALAVCGVGKKSPVRANINAALK